jgi:hypothetical protein
MSAARSRASRAAIMRAHRSQAPLGDEARQPRVDAQQHAAPIVGVAALNILQASGDRSARR